MTGLNPEIDKNNKGLSVYFQVKSQGPGELHPRVMKESDNSLTEFLSFSLEKCGVF